MRGVPQATLSRLPSARSGPRWSSWLTVFTRERRRLSTDRLETLERVRRDRRMALRTESPSSELAKQWLRRF